MRTSIILSVLVLSACDSGETLDQQGGALGPDEHTNVYIPISSHTFVTDIPVDVAVEDACGYGGTAILTWPGATQLGDWEHPAILENHQNGCPAEASEALLAAEGCSQPATVTLNLTEAYLFGPDDDCHRGWYEQLTVQFVGNELVFQNTIWTERDVLTVAECETVLALEGL
jgi:hypothetical protein